MAVFQVFLVVVCSSAWIVAAIGHAASDGVTGLAVFDASVGSICLAILCIPPVMRSWRSRWFRPVDDPRFPVPEHDA